jgi:steroid delta-isomerase-like uncharacterized protein
MDAKEIVKNYYACFNAKDWNGMLALVSPEVRHEANQGGIYIGKEKFAAFVKRMEECYDEQLEEMVIMGEGDRVAAEFVVHGVYKLAEEGLPVANNQKYVLPAGAFLEVTDGLISRVTTYYNLPLWISMVS